MLIDLLRKTDIIHKEINNIVLNVGKDANPKDFYSKMNEINDKIYKANEIYQQNITSITENYYKVIDIFLEERKKLIEKSQFKEDNWRICLSNSKPISNLITDEDYKVLKHLTNIDYQYNSQSNSKTITFSFNKNDYFNNKTLSKTIKFNNDESISSINSDKINWKEGKDLTKAIEKREIINKKTNEKKYISEEIYLSSFFNFFCSIDLEALKEKIQNSEEDKEIIERLVLEENVFKTIYSNLIPYSFEYFIGFPHDNNLVNEYYKTLFCEDDSEFEDNN